MIKQMVYRYNHFYLIKFASYTDRNPFKATKFIIIYNFPQQYAPKFSMM